MERDGWGLQLAGDYPPGRGGFLSCSDRPRWRRRRSHRLWGEFKACRSWGTRRTSRGHSSRDAPVKTPSSGLHLGEPTGHPAQQHSTAATHTHTHTQSLTHTHTHTHTFIYRALRVVKVNQQQCVNRILDTFHTIKLKVKLIQDIT